MTLGAFLIIGLLSLVAAFVVLMVWDGVKAWRR